MAYSTGAYNNQHDLLDKLRLFLIDNGWAVNLWDDDVFSYAYPSLSTAGKRLHVSKDGMYFNLRSCVRAFPFSHYNTVDITGDGTGQQYYSEITGIALYGSTGYSTTREVAITSCVSGGTGKTAVYAPGHTFKVGDSVTITGTTDYNGTHTISASTYSIESHFAIDVAYTSSQTGTVEGPCYWDKQPGYPAAPATTYKSTGVCINFVSSAGTYYFFASSNIVIVSVEYAAGKYQWLAFGKLVTYGTVTGGEFFAGCAGNYQTSQCYVPGKGRRFLTLGNAGGTSDYLFAARVNVDSKNTWRISKHGGRGGYDTSLEHLDCSCITSAAAISTTTWQSRFLNSLFDRSPNSFNGIAALLPVFFCVERSSGAWSPLGYIDILRQVNMLYKSPGEIVTFGADEWVCLPQAALAGESINTVGFAVKK